MGEMDYRKKIDKEKKIKEMEISVHGKRRQLPSSSIAQRIEGRNWKGETSCDHA